MPGLIDAYRAASEDIASAIGVVATRRGGLVHAVTVDSFLDVSYDPPTMLVSLYEGARITEALEDAQTWTLSVLRHDQVDIATWLGTPGQPVYGLMDSVPTEVTAAGGVRIARALAWFDLTTVSIADAATHRLFIGEVLDCGRTPHEKGNQTAPLLRFDTTYGRFTSGPS